MKIIRPVMNEMLILKIKIRLTITMRNLQTKLITNKHTGKQSARPLEEHIQIQTNMTRINHSDAIRDSQNDS